MTKQTIIGIVTFFAIAFGLTFTINQLPTTNFYSIDIKDILCGFGPLISGLICFKLFQTESSYSIGGSQPIKAWLVVVVSVITFLATSSKNTFEVSLIFVLTQLIYCFGEEFGWRNYLQSTTDKMNSKLQPFIIGLVWFCWHFSWLQDPMKSMLGSDVNAPFAVAVGMTILLLSLLSAFLGWFITKTKSVLFPTIIHFVLKTNSTTTMVTVLLAVIVLLTWDKYEFNRSKTSL